MSFQNIFNSTLSLSIRITIQSKIWMKQISLFSYGNVREHFEQVWLKTHCLISQVITIAL